MFNLTYEFKLKPTTTQTAIFEDWLEQCRRVYNYARFRTQTLVSIS